MKNTSNFYPPILLEDVGVLYGLTDNEVNLLATSKSLIIKEIGKKIYVSQKSLEKYKENYPKNRKELVKRKVRALIREHREEKVLEYAKFIQSKNKAADSIREAYLKNMNIVDCVNIALNKVDDVIVIDFKYDFSIPYSKLKDAFAVANKLKYIVITE